METVDNPLGEGSSRQILDEDRSEAKSGLKSILDATRRSQAREFQASGKKAKWDEEESQIAPRAGPYEKRRSLGKGKGRMADTSTEDEGSSAFKPAKKRRLFKHQKVFRLSQEENTDDAEEDFDMSFCLDNARTAFENKLAIRQANLFSTDESSCPDIQQNGDSDATLNTEPEVSVCYVQTPSLCDNS